MILLDLDNVVFELYFKLHFQTIILDFVLQNTNKFRIFIKYIFLSLNYLDTNVHNVDFTKI